MVKLLLDCDPGVDDAIAIAVALGSPQADLLAVTTVAGNVELARTTANALRVLDSLGRDDVPVVPGADLPLAREPVLARHVHGADGLGGAPLPPPTREPAAGHAADRIVAELAAAPGEVTLVAVGPLTNVALALRREPRIARWARRLVVMGGCWTGGNITPHAEFNVHADPDAAAEVLAAPWEPVLLGLDLTLQVRVGPDVLRRWAGYGALSERLLVPALGGYRDGADDLGPAVHDACALVCALHPELFTLTPAVVSVETSDQDTLGRTHVEWSPPQGVGAGTPCASDHSGRALVATAVDVPALWAVMESAFTRLSADVRER